MSAKLAWCYMLMRRKEGWKECNGAGLAGCVEVVISVGAWLDDGSGLGNLDL